MADPTPPTGPDAPSKEKMDEIRRRRMAMLSGTGSGSVEAVSTAVPANEAASTSNLAPAPATSSRPNIGLTKATPPALVPQKTASGPSSSPTLLVRTVIGGVLGKHARDAETGTQNKPSKATTKIASGPIPMEPFEIVQNRLIQQIFKVTVDPDQVVSNKLLLLPQLRQSLQDEGAEVRLKEEHLDEAIREAASTIPPNKSLFDYLLPCWKRIMKAIKAARGYASPKDALLKEMKRLTMSHCIFASGLPELYAREPNHATDHLTPYFLYDGEEDRGICRDFLEEVVGRFDDDDMAKSMVMKAFSGLSAQLSGMTMNDLYKPYIDAFKMLTMFKPITVAISQEPLFHWETSAPNIEKQTLLGPFFMISPLQHEVSKEYFRDPQNIDKRSVVQSQDAMRLTLANHQKDLLHIVNHFIKSGTDSRGKILDWFAYIVNTNHKRRAIQVNPKQVASDGFMLNVTVVLDGLCEPFMDTTFSKISRIEGDYFHRSPRVNITDETKLNGDDKASTAYYENTKITGESNFISEVFFLSVAAHHYGTEAIATRVKSLGKEMKNLQSDLQHLREERAKIPDHHPSARPLDINIARYVGVLEKSMCQKFASEGVLFDKVMQAKSLTFMRYVTVWLLRVAGNADYTPEKSFTLPLPDDAPEQFKFLPEYFLEDIITNFTFIIQSVPDVMISAVGDEINTLCITFLTNSTYVKNPYLKAKLVTLMYNGVWPVYHRKKGVLGDQLAGTPFANKYLLHALMKFYIECEVTGAHTQFFDKFNIRYEIFQVIKCVWSNTVYQDNLTKESKVNKEFFLRFVNLLLNDATFVLGEALTKFPIIHSLQRELAVPGDQSSLTAEQRAEKEKELSDAEGSASSYMQLVNETIDMMKLFTEALSESFVMPEIVDRVAAMLNQQIDLLVGAKSSDMKVEDANKYKFHPKPLLSSFVDIYLNLGISAAFIEAVARDGRSYKPINFDKVSTVIAKSSLKSGEEIDAWKRLVKAFASAKEVDEQAEEDLGDIPDEFLDPLLFTFMSDPVILPTSKMTLDRKVIKEHLLSDPHDPFNRAPLSIEDCMPDTELLARIQAFKLEAMAKAKMARESRMDVDVEVSDDVDMKEG